MPGLGALNAFPLRMGGGKRRVKYILDSLNMQRGTGYDTSQLSVIYLENLAAARILDGMWSTNQRLANQGDSARMTTCIPRYEAILNLKPLPTDSDQTRRARIAALEAREGQGAIFSVMVDALTRGLGSFFVSLDTISVSVAYVTVPDGSYPFGVVNSAAGPWTSTVDHLLVRLQSPAGTTDADFYAAAGKALEIVNPVLPAWQTVDWYRAPSGLVNGAITATPIAVAGGPSGAGFYLDDSHNLDWSVFDV